MQTYSTIKAIRYTTYFRVATNFFRFSPAKYFLVKQKVFGSGFTRCPKKNKKVEKSLADKQGRLQPFLSSLRAAPDGISKRKLRTYAKISDKSSRLQKENQENEIVQCTTETNASIFDDTKRNEEHVRLALTNSTHDSSSNDKNCDWFFQVNAVLKKTTKGNLLTMTIIMEFVAIQNVIKIKKIG